MSLDSKQLQPILEAALMVAGRPLSLNDLLKLFDEADQPAVADIQTALLDLQTHYSNRGVELREVASGFQFQANLAYSPWLSRLWEERAPRYSRAVLETIALIAYRQPITRAEIEEIRGVSVSSHIVKTLLERDWIRVIGHRDVPGKPALYGTTKQLLDHLNLKSLQELPTLAALKDLDSQEEKLQVQLELSNQAEHEINQMDLERSETIAEPAHDSNQNTLEEESIADHPEEPIPELSGTE